MAENRADLAPIGELRGGMWTPLPGWARFLIEIGRSAVRAASRDRLLTVALALPTRRFAACLVASGGVVSAYEGADAVSLRAHFTRVAAAPINTPLRLTSRSRVFRGRLKGVRSGPTEPLIGVQVEDARSGGLIRWIPQSRCRDVELAGEEAEFELPQHAKGQALPQMSGFLRTVLAPLDARDYFLSGEIDCAITGSVRTLMAEAQENMLAARHEGATSVAGGNLNDILQVRQLSTAPHTALVPATARRSPRPQRIEPILLVHDGATGYLRSGRQTSTPVMVVVLDRTEPRFDEAVAQLDQDYVRRTEDQALNLDLGVPPGVEVLSFRMSR